MSAGRQSRAFWVIPCQPIQELYRKDPTAGNVLMKLIAEMSMNDGYNGLPAYHVSASQRQLAQSLGLTRKEVRGALARLEKSGPISPQNGRTLGTSGGPTGSTVYRIALLADESTAYQAKGPSEGPPKGPETRKKGPPNIQTEISDREQTNTSRRKKTATPDELTVLQHYQTTHPKRRVLKDGAPVSDRLITIVRTALGWGFSPAELIEAIDGNLQDPWHYEKRKHELAYILRTSEKVDDFRDRYDWGQQPSDLVRTPTA